MDRLDLISLVCGLVAVIGWASVSLKGLRGLSTEPGQAQASRDGGGGNRTRRLELLVAVWGGRSKESGVV
jgi:hypothetical protein